MERLGSPEEVQTPPPFEDLIRTEQGPFYGISGALPLPEGMWAELDPDVVTATCKQMNERPEEERTTTRLPSQLREHLEAGGPAAHKLLDILGQI